MGRRRVPRWRPLLVDDHALFREGLAGLFAYQEGFAVVGEAEDADGALAQVERLRPDLVLMDIDLPARTASAPRAASRPRSPTPPS
jgi:two-component system, NarL family, response regulator YdfI